MAADLLLALGWISLVFSIAVVLVFLLRPGIRRWAGARVTCALWLIPVVATISSLLPAPIAPRLSEPGRIVFAAAEPAVQAIVNLPVRLSAVPAGDAAFDVSTWLAGTWCIGLALSIGLLTWRQRRFSSSIAPLRRDVRLGVTVFVSDTTAGGPALVGVFRPRLVVPADFDTRFTHAEQVLVLAHEQMHLQRADPILNALVAMVRCAFWFNPLAHLAARAIRFDQELACDEATLARQPDMRLPYANAMLKTQVPSLALPLGCAWPSRRSHPFNQRIAMLTRTFSASRRAAGTAITAVLLSFSAYTAWASQPRSASPVVLQPVVAAQPAPTPQASAVDAVDEIMPGDGTRLIIAARRGSLARVQGLLDRGADPNLPAPGDGNPLIAAVMSGRRDVVALLVERGADVNAYVAGDETPLITAAARGHLEVVRYLVEHGAGVNMAFDVELPNGRIERRSPLSQAVRFGHDAVAAYLRSTGAQP